MVAYGELQGRSDWCKISHGRKDCWMLGLPASGALPATLSGTVQARQAPTRLPCQRSSSACSAKYQLFLGCIRAWCRNLAIHTGHPIVCTKACWLAWLAQIAWVAHIRRAISHLISANCHPPDYSLSIRLIALRMHMGMVQELSNPHRSPYWMHN